MFAASWALGLASLLGFARLPADHLLRRLFSFPPKYEVLELHEGVNETIAILERPGAFRTLFTNGHSMSSTSIDGQRYMRAFAHVPLLLHPEPRTAMVMCFGVGNTLAATLLHPLERVDMVDYSADVLRHARYFEEANGRPLEDPRVRVFVNDARQHLRMQPPESYDLITGEPPPIPYAGVVNLYSREFFALARSRLRPGGLLSYWFPIDQVSEEVARSLVRAFVDVFPESVLLSGYGNELILLGSNGALPQVDLARLAARSAEPAIARDLRAIFLDRPEELVGALAATAETMRRASRDAAPVTDDRPSLEYGGVQFVRRPSRPPDLFDVSDAERWCPACFAPGASPAFQGYLAVVARIYVSPDFLTRRPGQRDQPMRFQVPRGPGVEAAVKDSLFLRRMLGLWRGDFARAVDLLREGRAGAAAAILEDVVLMAPENANAHAKLGEAYLGVGRSAEAGAQFERALRLSPALAGARIGLERARSAPPAG